jgi:hypothetical protein
MRNGMSASRRVAIAAPASASVDGASKEARFARDGNICNRVSYICN